MKATIEVKNAKDRDAIRLAMTDPVIYASTVVCGHLMELPSKRSRQRVLNFVCESIADELENRELPL